MKIKLKVVLVIMSIMSLLNLVACGNRDKEAAEKIEKYLAEKYGEEFVVDGLGGGYGTVTTNTLKAKVYLKESPHKKFDVEITKDLKTIWDDYMNVVMGEKMDKVATDLAKPIFGEEIWVKTRMRAGGLSFPKIELNDKKMELLDYFKATSIKSRVIDVYIKSDPNIDTHLQAEKVDQFATKLINYGIDIAYIDVQYLKASVFDEIPTEYYSLENVDDYYGDRSRRYINIWMQIKDFKKEQNINEIMENIKQKYNK